MKTNLVRQPNASAPCSPRIPQSLMPVGGTPKRRFSCLSALLFLLAVLPAVAGSDSREWKFFVFSSTKYGTITVWDNLGLRGMVNIPSKINGLPVITIGKGAFAYDYGVTGVTIPSPVATIEKTAFFRSDNLTSITLPVSLSDVEPGAFDSCTSLHSITVDALNPYFSTVEGALFDKKQTTLLVYPGGRGGSYVIPDSVTNIAGYAFSGLHRLTNVVIPDSVTEIGSSAFVGCSGLPNVTIPDSVTAIRSNLFLNCSGLTSFTIPDSVTEIGSKAFSGCTGLTSVTLGKQVARIDSNAFNGCTGLTRVTIPDSVTSIGSSAFYGCNSLTEIRIGSGVTNIDSQAFGGCPFLFAITVEALNPRFSSTNGVLFDKSQTTLIQYPAGRPGLGLTGKYTVPNSVTTIGTRAFEAAFLTSVTLGNNVTNIESYAFYNCPFLANLTIPSQVSSIETKAFGGCKILTGVYFEGDAPKLGSSVFSGAKKSTIYHFEGAAGWGSKFGGRPAKLWYPENTQLEVRFIGSGTLTPNYSFAMLQPGTTNSMTAAGANGYAFQKWILSTNWGDGVTLTNNKLTFVMQSNLTINAIFIPSAYVGLFMPSAAGDVAATNSGSVALNLTDKGKLSGKLILAGKSLSFSGAFDLEGRANLTVKRSGNSPLILNLGFDFLSVTGLVSATNWTSDLLALPRALGSSSAFAGPSSMLILGDHGAVDAPPGDSPLTVSVSGPYSIKVSGKMADGSAVSASASLTTAPNGAWPFYQSLYSGKGLTIGWMSWVSNAVPPVVQWVMAPNERAKYYPAGFAGERVVALQRYVAPKSPENALGWTNGRLFLGGGNLAAPLDADVLVTNKQIKSVSGTVSNLSLTITDSTGLFSGSFKHPVTLKKVTIRGGVVQGLPWVPPAVQVGVGGGWFLGTNQGGYLWLEPKP